MEQEIGAAAERRRHLFGDPAGSLVIRIGELEACELAVVRRDDLQSGRQARVVEAAGYLKRRL